MCPDALRSLAPGALPPSPLWQHAEASGKNGETPRAPRSPTASRPCGIGPDLSLAGLGVWTLARPAAWQHPSLAAQRWSEFFHFSAGLASLEQTWPRPAPAPGSGADSDLDMLATEFVWCPGDERMCKFPLRPAPPLVPISLSCSPSFPCLWTLQARALRSP